MYFKERYIIVIMRLTITSPQGLGHGRCISLRTLHRIVIPHGSALAGKSNHITSWWKSNVAPGTCVQTPGCCWPRWRASLAVGSCIWSVTNMLSYAPPCCSFHYHQAGPSYPVVQSAGCRWWSSYSMAPRFLSRQVSTTSCAQVDIPSHGKKLRVVGPLVLSSVAHVLPRLFAFYTLASAHSTVSLTCVYRRGPCCWWRSPHTSFRVPGLDSASVFSSWVNQSPVRLTCTSRKTWLGRQATGGRRPLPALGSST